MKAIILVSLLVVGISAIPLQLQQSKVKYDNYKVYRFIPTNEAELKVLEALETEFPGVLFWKRVGKIGNSVDVMIPPHLQPEILSGLQATTLAVNEPLVADVQQLIDEEEAANKAALKNAPKLGWEAYYSFEEISQWLDEQAAANPDVASIEVFGKSFENRDLKVIKISTGGNGEKPIIWIDANIHAREWITNAVATYIVNELLNGETSGVRGLLDSFDFWVVPVLNPDGYAYTISNDRMWRKTRSNFAGALCRGADPNRNWDFQWNTGGASSICSSETYHGVSAFSEPETLAASQLLDSIRDRVRAYLSLHSYSQLILIPYGNDLGRIPDHDNHMRVGRLVETAIARRYGTQFESGNIVELLYVASGASVDYMKGVHDTTLSYTFELRDTGRYGFILPPAQILPSSLEFCDGLMALANDLKVQLKK